MSNYSYYSGANVSIYVNNKELLECAGISFSYQNSRQPIYGYNSTLFDAMLPGREIIQGNFLINYVETNYLLSLLNIEDNNSLSYNALTSPSFDIKIQFGDYDNFNYQTLKDCHIVSMGKSIQITEQVIVEEYGFIARNIEI
jgi:hypothetical protein